jgi:hypothetical protein
MSSLYILLAPSSIWASGGSKINVSDPAYESRPEVYLVAGFGARGFHQDQRNDTTCHVASCDMTAEGKKGDLDTISESASCEPSFER